MKNNIIKFKLIYVKIMYVHKIILLKTK